MVQTVSFMIIGKDIDLTLESREGSNKVEAEHSPDIIG